MIGRTWADEVKGKVCDSQPPRQPPIDLHMVVFTTCITTLYWGWSVWPIECRGIEGILRLKWGYKRSSHLSTQSLYWRFLQEISYISWEFIRRDPCGKNLHHKPSVSWISHLEHKSSNPIQTFRWEKVQPTIELLLHKGPEAIPHNNKIFFTMF